MCVIAEKIDSFVRTMLCTLWIVFSSVVAVGKGVKRHQINKEVQERSMFISGHVGFAIKDMSSPLFHSCFATEGFLGNPFDFCLSVLDCCHCAELHCTKSASDVISVSNHHINTVSVAFCHHVSVCVSTPFALP